MLTYDDGFSGAGLATCGALAAGLTPIGAVEYDPTIAECYRKNLGDHITVAPIQEIDWTARSTPFWRHMSPVCTRFSQANSDGVESELDIAAAQAVIRSIEVHPPMFSLENVWQYRDSESFKMIYRALRANSYDVQYWHLNSADYGVPQTRKRLILVASQVSQVKRPMPTHAERTEDTGQSSMFDPLPNWIGWYEAIEDLIPALKPDRFADWQTYGLPNITPIVVGSQYETWKGNDKRIVQHRLAYQPIFTITTKLKCDARARIGNREYQVSHRARARLQSLPDWYELPNDIELSQTVIGNGLPCDLMTEVIKANLS